MTKFDVAILGGGPGGYVSAIRAAKEGLSVALIEGEALGGACLNRGCIPSKTWLKQAEILNQIYEAKMFGIMVDNVSFSMKEMVKRKNNVITTLQNGIRSLLMQNKITIFNGFGKVTEEKEIQVDDKNGSQTIHANHIILATGSTPVVPAIKGVEGIDYYTSDTIFDIDFVPKQLLIVGGGVIGLEIACIFNSLGSKVEVVEMGNKILPNEDVEASTFLMESLKEKGIVFHINTKLTSFKKIDGVTVATIEQNGQQTKVETDYVLMAVGRKPNTNGFKNLSLKYDGSFVKVNEHMQTSVSNVYAIGDLIGGYQLAHAASDEGIRAINHIVGNEVKINQIVPRCVYTFPEIASVGISEDEAKRNSIAYKVKKISLAGNGKAITAGENKGFMKILADEKYGEILGVVMVGANVTEMISLGTSFITLEGTVEEMDQMVFPHPTISESLKEVAAAWVGKAIHYM